MLGFMGLTNPDINGVDESRYNVNPNDNSKVYQVPSSAMSEQNDPMHELGDMLDQMKNNNGHFVSNYVARYPDATRDQIQEVMGYYKDGEFPALHTLAKHFMVCDNWFASMPGPTWPNRAFAHTGTSIGYTDMPDSGEIPHIPIYDQDTVYDLLQDNDISWRIYFDEVPQSIVLLHQLEYLDNYSDMCYFEEDCKGPAADFPAYVFIEPNYFGDNENDQHPPSNLMNGDILIAKVYNAIRSNAELWESSLLIITYDENGGFYDHVTPPKTVAPDRHTIEFDFKILGFRVPAILVSPLVKTGVDHTLYDHTSILRYLCDKWALDTPCLGKRVLAANTFEHLLHYYPGHVSPESLPVGTHVPNIASARNTGEYAMDMVKDRMDSASDETKGKANKFKFSLIK